MPKLVQPNSAKMDMDALKTSIPKFSCLSHSDLMWWIEFLKALEGSFSENLDPLQWPYITLKELSRSISTEKEQLQLPPRLVARHFKTTEPIPEVSYYLLHTIYIIWNK